MFQFCRHVESMTIDYHEAIRLDPRLRRSQKFFVFIFVILQNHSFTKKGHTDTWKTIASVVCENVQMAQKRALINTDYRRAPS